MYCHRSINTRVRGRRTPPIRVTRIHTPTLADFRSASLFRGSPAHTLSCSLLCSISRSYRATITPRSPQTATAPRPALTSLKSLKRRIVLDPTTTITSSPAATNEASRLPGQSLSVYLDIELRTGSSVEPPRSEAIPGSRGQIARPVATAKEKKTQTPRWIQTRPAFLRRNATQAILSSHRSLPSALFHCSSVLVEL